MININGDIGIIMGGPSSEHDISLRSGQMLISALSKKYNNLKPLVVTQEGKWQVENKIMQMDEALSDIKVAILATHGQWGEDGHLQAILEHFKIPYTGSRVGASLAAFDKSVSRGIFRLNELEVPQAFTIERNSFSNTDRVKDVLNLIPKGPWVVKPTEAGSSVGISVVKKEEDMPRALEEAWKYGPSILIEEYIDGIEVTCGILENIKTKQPQALPLTQIIPPAHHIFFDFSAKYSGETQEITPAKLDKKLVSAAQDTALQAHKAIGARHYSRVDMILKDGKPYVLELNTLPGLTAESLLPKQAQAAGIGFTELLEHLMGLALAE